MKILNIGCGTKTSASPRVVNIDWSPYLRIQKSRVARALAPIALSGERKARFNALGDNVLIHDLSSGLPFEDGSVDAAYHSHFLEHLDRDRAPVFLDEVRRVLRSGGVQRIVVPDLEALCRQYLRHLDACASGTGDVSKHDGYIGEVIEQCVRREASGTSQQPAMRRALENAILGDARRRGETHQWMYDRISLSTLLESVGFKEPKVVDYTTSAVAGWNALGLDRGPDGAEYKPGSLYVECIK